MIAIDSLRGRTSVVAVLGTAMLEIGSMPLWVGVLIGHYGFDPRQAGSLLSLYMAGAVIAAFIVVPIFGRLSSGRAIASGGLLLGAATFYALTLTNDFMYMAILHLLGGLFVGPVIAVTNGTIGRSENPHRLFAISALFVSLVAAGFLAVMPTVVSEAGGIIFFQVIGAIFVIGGLVSLWGFPEAAPDSPAMLAIANKSDGATKIKIPAKVWYGFAGLICLSSVYTMTMSFVERIGMDRGYGLALVSTVLTIMAIVKLFPAALAGLMQNQVTPRTVLFIAPIIQAICSALIFAVPITLVYAIAAPVFIAPMLFAQVFVVGLIAKLEPTGRASALSPSLMMIGSVIGPVLGGTIVKAAGYSFLAIVSLSIACIAIFCFLKMTSQENLEPVVQT